MTLKAIAGLRKDVQHLGDSGATVWVRVGLQSPKGNILGGLD